MKFLKIFRREQDESLTEAEQILAYQQTGSLRVLGKLYQPYMEMVFSVCYKYLRNEDESKDAVMQIFEKLVDDLKNHEVANFKSWLHRVAVNHSLMQIRAKRVFVEVNGVLELDEFIDPGENEGMLKLEGNLSSLERCMETLNNEQRVSISLFFKEEKCYREISDETGFDFNKVKSYIQNGKRNLKICMDKNGTI